MFKLATESDIESIKFILRNYVDFEKKQDLLDIQCKKYKINSDFVREFQEFIKKEAFSTSPGLSYDVIKQFPNLFDINIWINSKEKSLEPLLDDEFSQKLSSDEIGNSIKLSNPTLITEDIFNKFFNDISEEYKEILVNRSTLAANSGFLEKYSAYVNEEIFKNLKIRIDWTNALIENILTNKSLTFKFLITALSQSDDLAFIKRMLTSTDLTFKPSGGTLDQEMKILINRLPEDYLEALFSCAQKENANALSYEVLQHVLKMNDELTEQFILDYINQFKEVGMIPELASYARYRDYRAVLLNLHLS